MRSVAVRAYHQHVQRVVTQLWGTRNEGLQALFSEHGQPLFLQTRVS